MQDDALRQAQSSGLFNFNLCEAQASAPQRHTDLIGRDNGQYGRRRPKPVNPTVTRVPTPFGLAQLCDVIAIVTQANFTAVLLQSFHKR